MSEARDRLRAAVDGDYVLDAILDNADDLLAVLVEAGVLEERYPLDRDGPIYCRTEGGQR